MRMTQKQVKKPAYREVQRARQFWIWAIVLVVAGLLWYAAVLQLLLGHSFGARPMPDAALVVLWIILGVGLPALLLSSKLTTEVRDDGVYIRYSPFHRSFRRIAFKDLTQYKVRTYHPILEYGGWGIRYGARGKAYNMSGNRGVELELADGGRLMIGSQRPEDLWKAIQEKIGKAEREHRVN